MKTYHNSYFVRFNNDQERKEKKSYKYYTLHYICFIVSLMKCTQEVKNSFFLIRQQRAQSLD